MRSSEMQAILEFLRKVRIPSIIKRFIGLITKCDEFWRSACDIHHRCGVRALLALFGAR
jgi:hypothetical protein